MREFGASTVALTGEFDEPAELGGKGAALDRLVGWGIRVPPTGVVTAHAYRTIATTPGPAALVARLTGDTDSCDEYGEADVDRVFAATRPPPALRDDIVALGREIGAGRRVAVRSSATVEDLARSSFAGLYRSVLDVDPDDPDALVAAVLSVFASLWHPQARAYRRALGIDEHDIAMAAVVMQMVPATRAGVTFTVDPGDPSRRARVEAVDGLGESLVSGERTPDAWLLDPADIDPRAPREIRAALDASRRIEELSGCPQDVEWAWDGEELWVVQARPITTADGALDDGDGVDSPTTEADLTTAGIGEMLPGVLAPLVWRVTSHLVDEAFSTVLDGLGLSDTTNGLVRRVRGRAALDFSQLHRMASLLPGGAGDELERQYFGSRRSGRPAAPAQPAGSRLAAARHDVRVLVQQHRATQDADIVTAAVQAVRHRRPDLTVLADDELLRYRYRLLDLGVRAMTAELTCAAAAAASYRRLELTLAAHVDETEAGRLAGTVTTQPGVIAVPAADASAAVFAGPTWQETGRAPPRPPIRTDRGDPIEDLRERLAATRGFDGDSPLSWLRWKRIERVIDSTVDQLRRREHTKVAVLELGGEVRRVHLECGRRLRSRGLLEQPTDVDLLTQDELAAAVTGAVVTADVLGRRRRWIQQYEAEGPLPIRFSGRPERRVVELPPGERLEGWGASSGRCTSRACFLTGPGEPLPAGAILLAEATDASWSPLFLRAGAIVLERGGPLSHAAILARELGVPAVLNVGTSVRLLDGCALTVDGDSGIVVVHGDDDGGERP